MVSTGVGNTHEPGKGRRGSSGVEYKSARVGRRDDRDAAAVAAARACGVHTLLLSFAGMRDVTVRMYVRVTVSRTMCHTTVCATETTFFPRERLAFVADRATYKPTSPRTRGSRGIIFDIVFCFLKK